jgi:hypothetical protein
VPTVVGCGGARQQVELPFTQQERLGLQQSARVLRETIGQVETRIDKGLASGGRRTAPVIARVIPRSAWQPGSTRKV